MKMQKTWVSDQEYVPANVKGKLKGYCKRCGMMIIDGKESSCPKCGHVKLTEKAPEEKKRIYATGMTARTKGHPNQDDRY